MTEIIANSAKVVGLAVIGFIFVLGIAAVTLVIVHALRQGNNK